MYRDIATELNCFVDRTSTVELYYVRFVGYRPADYCDQLLKCFAVSLDVTIVSIRQTFWNTCT